MKNKKFLAFNQLKKWYTSEDYQQFDLVKKQQGEQQFNQLFELQKKVVF
jgi:hypothetical protein